MQNSGRVARFILFERSEFIKLDFLVTFGAMPKVTKKSRIGNSLRSNSPILASRPTTQNPPVQFFPKGFFSKLSHKKIGNDS